MLRQISCFVKFHAASNFMMPTSIVRCGLVTRQENEATRFPPKRLLWFFVNMAESEEGGSPVEFSTAISLLRQAANILSGLNNPTNTSTTSATTSSTPKASSRVSFCRVDKFPKPFQSVQKRSVVLFCQKWPLCVLQR